MGDRPRLTSKSQNSYKKSLFISKSLAKDVYEFTLRFSNSPWIHFSAKSLCMNYLLRVSLWIYYLFCEFTICFAISLRVHYLFPKINMNALFFSRINYLLRDFTRNSILVDYFSPIREFPLNSLSSVNSLSFPLIHYLFREFTLNLLFSHKITMNSPSFFAI